MRLSCNVGVVSGANGLISSTMLRMMERSYRFQNFLNGEPLDVLVVGGGITGAPLYRQLCELGYRVALADKGDFSSGSSQASGMLIWGGLLYLKNLDLLTVIQFCKARNELMMDFPDAISVLNLRYPVSFPRFFVCQRVGFMLPVFPAAVV